jgi:hypothetical protein
MAVGSNPTAETPDPERHHEKRQTRASAKNWSTCHCRLKKDCRVPLCSRIAGRKMVIATRKQYDLLQGLWDWGQFAKHVEQETCTKTVAGVLNASANHGLLLQLENTELREDFPAPQAAFLHGRASALGRHVLTTPHDDGLLVVRPSPQLKKHSANETVLYVFIDASSIFLVAATVCPSGLRGWTQVPLAKAAWVQIPQLSLRHPPLGSAQRGYKPGHSSCRPLSPCNNLRVCLPTCQVFSINIEQRRFN